MSRLAETIDARRHALVTRWTARVRAELDPGPCPQPELEDHIPQLLVDLVAELRRHPAEPTPSEPMARAHGAQRFRIGFSLPTLLAEYRLLREVLLEETTTIPEVRAVGAFLDRAIADGVQQYVQHRDREHKRMHALLMQAPVALAIVEGPEHRFAYSNAAYRVMIGGREVDGRPALEAVPELRGQGFGALLDQVVATGEPYIGREVPARIDRSGTGEVEDVIYNFVYAPLRDGEGRVEGVLASGYEVTEQVLARRRVEALALQLRETERRYRTLNDTGIVGVVEWHASGAITAANDSFLAMTGYSREDLEAGRLDFRRMTPATARPAAEQALQTVADTGVALPFETQYLRKDGGLIDVVASSAALDETRQRGIALILDITARKTAERELQARAEFEQYLVGIVSHDLRNPLNAIMLGAQILGARADLDERAQRTIDRVRSSAERAARMISDLLDFTRARIGGGIEIKPGPVDLAAAVRQVAEELEAIHPGRRVTIGRDGDTHGTWDGDRIAQAVGNLVGNALAYSDEGSEVAVRLHGEAEAVTIEVHNPGAPIPAEKLGSIFEPMQRGSADAGSGRSIGLGLFIVRHIARAHGGDVAVTSSAEAGTTFTLRLPRHARASDTIAR